MDMKIEKGVKAEDIKKEFAVENVWVIGKRRNSVMRSMIYPPH
jgi:hypothetical protein